MPVGPPARVISYLGCILVSATLGAAATRYYDHYLEDFRVCVDLGGPKAGGYIDGRGGDDTVILRGTNATVLGGEGNDRISDIDAKSDRHSISYLSGGTGSDSFTLHAGNAAYSVITDFVPGEEHLTVAYPEGTRALTPRDLKAIPMSALKTDAPIVELQVIGPDGQRECLAVLQGRLDPGAILASVKEFITY